MPFPALVTRVNWDLKQAGLGVEVTYPGTGLTAQFIHLSAISGKVMPGQTVPVQTLFARTGISGATQIPHLEYRLFRQTEERIEPVDPFEFHGFDSYSIGPKNYKNFVSVKHQILAYLQNVNYKSK
jgi:murein DD-endopeptidase MepM/ murein hydrolase activator NlpD